MQREKNMTKTFKFVIATILFLTLFLIVKNVDGKLFFHPIQISFFCLYLVTLLYFFFFVTAQVKCKTVKDCPIRRNRKYYCLFGICKYDVM